MNRIAIFSDLHLHPFQPFSTISPENGLNSRLMDGINVLQQIRHYCQKNKISLVLNGGDLLHKGASVGADLLELLIRELVEFQKAGIEIVSVVGQHDFMRRDGEYSLPKALSPLMTVLNSPGDFKDISEQVRVIGCSYREGIWNQKEALQLAGESLDIAHPTRSNILLGHLMVQELLQANAAPFDTSGYISVADIPAGFDRVFLGDYHYHVAHGDVISIGAAMQHTFGDKNRPQCGFLDLDLKTLKFKRIEVEAPMFVKLAKPGKFPEGYDLRNFYAVEVEDEKHQDRIKARLGEGWHVTFPVKLTEEEEGLEPLNDVGIAVTMEAEEVVRKFVDHFGLSPEYLEKGLEYIKEA
jgi:DNA repair exonuclease SbcCD nuclease subunit